MSEHDDSGDEFAVMPASDDGGAAIGGTSLRAEERLRMLRARAANPDDPPVQYPPPGPGGPRGGADYYGQPGRLAIVQGQVYIVGVILVLQLWLITVALFELLSGNIGVLWPITIASFVGFLVALIVYIWPRRRAEGW
jgi:hypothetical protein